MHVPSTHICKYTTSHSQAARCTPLTSGDLGGADLTVMVVLRLDSHEWETMDVGARDMTARLASSVACEIVPLNPCRAAMMYMYGAL